jgi:hypothetical protein
MSQSSTTPPQFLDSGAPPLFLPVNAFVLHAEQPIAVGDEVRDLQLLWASIDSPWVHNIDPTRFRATVDPLRAMGASAVFSSHLPPVQQPDDLDGS